MLQKIREVLYVEGDSYKCKHFMGAKFINIEEFITSQLLYKSADEISIVHRAVEIIENVMEKGIRKVTPGMTEPHGHSGKRKIQNGDFLLIDMGVSVGGYCSDITRTFIVGEGSDQQVNMYDTVLEANEKAINSVKLENL